VSAEANEDREALERWASVEDRAGLGDDRNVLVNRGEKAVEVYQRLRSPSGREAMLELYVADSSIADGSRRVWLAFAPALLMGLLVLEIVQLPIAWALARRVRRGELDRARLVRGAVESSGNERRRIAAMIHDRVIHNLAGGGLTLEAVARQARSDGQSTVSEAIEEAASATRQSIRDLRTLLVDIYPPDLHSRGLEAALSDLLTPLLAAGLDARLTSERGVELGHLAQAVVYRVAKESLENVLQHAKARTVRVSLSAEDRMALLLVEDDGRGFSPAEIGPEREGHFGLRLLMDLVAAADGSLEVESGLGRGTRIRAEVLNE
jgi:signal transduction histidine kinase